MSPADTPDDERSDPADRRRARRTPSAPEHGIVAVRVRPGIQANLVNVSPVGVLLEADRRLLPGRFVHVQFVTGVGVATVRGRVVRSDVSRLAPGMIVYRCGVQFDQWVWFRGGGVALEAGHRHGARA